MKLIVLLLGIVCFARLGLADEVYPRILPAKDVRSALNLVLAGAPRVLAVGEQHQTNKTAKITSAIKRFTKDFLPLLLKAGATDLVVETWLSTGKCGEVEKQAVAEVETTTERPKATENEVLSLIVAAKGMGIIPRVLEVNCKDYQAFQNGGQVDYDKLLKFTGEQLRVQLEKAINRANSQMIVSYGGALHNDLQPMEELAPYAFGPTIAAAVDGQFVELDLYVPEYLGKDNLARTSAWYPLASKQKGLVLIQRGPASFVLIFPRGKKR